MTLGAEANALRPRIPPCWSTGLRLARLVIRAASPLHRVWWSLILCPALSWTQGTVSDQPCPALVELPFPWRATQDTQPSFRVRAVMRGQVAGG